MLDLSGRIDDFFQLVAQGRVEIYNEFSLQHELGGYLRSVLPARFRVQFERPVSFFDIKAQRLSKKEIDISVFTQDQVERIAIELKFPRNGQYPEQMFAACRDIAFLEELVRHGFTGGFFVMAADDPLFYQGAGQEGIYGCFRAGRPVLRQNSVRRQVIDLAGLIQRKFRLDGHPPAPPASTASPPLRRSPPMSPWKTWPCATSSPSTRRR